MIWWPALVAALAGWGLSDFSEWGFLLGGILGAAYGWIGRRTVRAEVATATGALRAQVEALAARLEARPGAGLVVPQPEVVSVEAPAPRAVAVAAPPVQSVPRGPERPVRREAVAPAEPGFVASVIAQAVAAARGWLLGGNTVVRVGLVMLFVGLSFLASYAASAGLFPIELRLALVALVGIALLGVGFRTRLERPGFGLALQGGGVAVIYLTLFAAAKLFDTVPVGPAFGLMIAVCALGCALALLQRSQALAATAFAGGFAVPLLLSDGTGYVAGLFGYYTVLNLAVLFIAGRQSWRVPNLIGFFATFGVMTLWEAASYRPQDFAVAQAFLVVSVLIYVATAVLYTRATPGRLGGVVDTTLLFGPAIAGFGLEVGLVHDRPFGSAFAALGFAALYLGVEAWLTRRGRAELRVMNEAMLAIGVGFVTLAVPLALGARWTSAAWALEGAGAFWVGMRQARWMPRLFGLVLQLVAALIYLGSAEQAASAWPIAHPAFVGAMLIAGAGLATAWWLRAALPHSGSRLATGYARGEAVLGRPAFLWGFAFFVLAWATEVTRAVPPGETLRTAMPVFTVGTQWLLVMLAYLASAWGAQVVARRLGWGVAAWPSYGSLPVLAIGLVGSLGEGTRVLYPPAWAIWIASLGPHGHMLHRNDRDADTPAARLLLRMTHAGGVWLATAMLADCLLLGIDRWRLWRASWAEGSLVLGLVLVLAGLTLWAGRALSERRWRWPLDVHAVDYAWVAAVPVAAVLALGALLVALVSAGSAAPLPYVPLLNPADLSVALALAALELWRRTIVAVVPAPTGAGVLDTRGSRVGLAGLAFVAVNTAWLRFAHHWLGVAWDPDALLDSAVVQTGLAILWTLVALALMIAAHRLGRRTLWLVGAGLLGLTVAKLLLVDLNTVGGAARIVAFMGVGVLMLVVGYLAPLPPKAVATGGEEATA